MRNKLLIAFLLYAAAFAVRAWHITEPAPQPDEIHWQSRSYEVLKRYRAGDWRHLTNHIGHPGIPPALVMAAGESAADHYNSRRGLTFGDTGFIDRLSASRIANASVSSFLAPVIYLGAGLLCGPGVGLLAGVLSVVEPHHISLSRQAHLDSLLTLFVVCTFFLYILAVRRRSSVLKVVAGIFWGLSIATKPTAATIVLACLLYKLLRRALSKEAGDEALIVWSDVWAVIAGQLTLGLLFTRLWYHESHHWRRLAIKSEIADVVYKVSGVLADQRVLTALLALGGVLLAMVLAKHKQAFLRHTALAAATLGVLALFCSLNPATAENLVRFWFWSIGLAGESHVAYGQEWSAPVGGYLGLVWARLPSLTIVGIAVSVVCSILWIVSASPADEKRKQATMVCSALGAAILWSAVLSASPKQTIRYLLPVIPLLTVAASIGFCGLLGALSGKRRALLLLLTLLLGSYQLIASHYQNPNFLVYFNNLSGGLPAALARGHQIPFMFQNDAIRFVHESAKRDVSLQKVLMRGDINTITYAYRRLYAGEERPVRFVHSKTAGGGYYFLTFPQFEQLVFGEDQASYPPQAFAKGVSGVRLVTVFDVALPDYETALSREVWDMDRRTAAVYSYSETQGVSEDAPDAAPVVIADPKKHEKGFVYFGSYLRFPKGRYEFSTRLAIPFGQQAPEDFPKNRAAIKLEFGEDCFRLARVEELSSRGFSTIRHQCEFEQGEGIQLRGYWWSKVPVVVKDITVERVPEKAPAEQN